MQTFWYFIIAFAAILLFILILNILSRLKGNLKLELDNYQFSPGDTIKGKLILKIKKPLDSKGLYVRLIGERRERQFTTMQNRRTTSSNETVFDFKQPIEGAKHYSPGETSHDFSIKIPSNLLSGKLSGIAGSVIKSIQILSGDNSMIRWYVKGELAVSGINLSKKVQINIA